MTGALLPSVSVLLINSPSTSSSLMSFTTAPMGRLFFPDCTSRFLKRVVLPEPKKPLRITTGVLWDAFMGVGIDAIIGGDLPGFLQ